MWGSYLTAVPRPPAALALVNTAGSSLRCYQNWYVYNFILHAYYAGRSHGGGGGGGGSLGSEEPPPPVRERSTKRSTRMYIKVH